MKKSLLANIANGAKWTAISRLTVRMIGFVSTIILARLLTPHDFGLVALGMIFISLLTLLGSFDFETVLIQHTAPTENHYHTAWTLNAAYFTLAALALSFSAPYLAIYYEVPQLSDIIHVLAIGFVAKGLASVRIIDFQKHFAFHYETLLRTSVKFIGFIVTISSAFILRNYWSLLIGVLATQISYLVISYILAPYRPRPTFLYVKELFSFSSWLMLANFINFINTKSVEFIIGKTLGTAPLGLYTVGESSAGMATQELTATVNRAAYPGYAKISESRSELKAVALRIISVISTIAFPAALGFYSVATPFVYAVLGKKWLAAVPVLEIISIVGLVNSLQSNVQYVLFALRRPRLHTAVSALKAIALLPLIYFLSVYHGIQGAAFAVLIGSAIQLPVNMLFLRKLLEVKLLDWFAICWRPAVAALTMTVALHVLLNPYKDSLTEPTAFVLLFCMIAAGGLAYALVLGILWALSGRPDGFEKDVLHWLRQKYASVMRKKI